MFTWMSIPVMNCSMPARSSSPVSDRSMVPETTYSSPSLRMVSESAPPPADHWEIGMAAKEYWAPV